ncbi:hypothetical protein RCOM_0934880 [Ricinus communis]|uniref:Uncharacterized protein n=1 Tax=Ricinus communis TaxID=3988 RepID=B9RZ44_RICCO|nr:hypothetical protein RCOM_0934880 [Ricinus communis]
MPTGGFCGLKPLLFAHRKLSRFEIVKSAHLFKSQKKDVKGPKMERSRRCTGNFILMMEFRRKIFTFRDIIDLPPCDGSESINELVARTIKDLYKFQPEIISRSQSSELKEACIDKVLIYFCEALRIIGDSWTKIRLDGQIEKALATLNCIIEIAKEKYDMMDEEDDQNKDGQPDTAFGKILMGSYSESNSPSFCSSPVTPTSVLPQYMSSPSSDEFPNISCSSPLLRSLRVQAVGKLSPIDIKRLSFHMPPNFGVQDNNTLNLKNNVEEDIMVEMEAEDKSSNQTNQAATLK